MQESSARGSVSIVRGNYESPSRREGEAYVFGLCRDQCPEGEVFATHAGSPGSPASPVFPLAATPELETLYQVSLYK